MSVYFNTAAQLCADHQGLIDPISTMFAYDQGDHTLPRIAPKINGGGTVSLRVEARNAEPQGALLPVGTQAITTT